MLRKFRCTVTQEHEIDIEIDDEKFTQKEIDEITEAFWPDINTYEKNAAHLAAIQLNGETESFIEGYGDVKRNGKFVNPLTKTNVDSGLNIIGTNEGVSWRDVEVEEIKQGE